MNGRRLPSSFRDPSGFVYEADGVLFRQVNTVYSTHYDMLMGSGLYDALVDREWLVPHEEVGRPAMAGMYRTLKPTRAPYVSYPHELCFSQIKDAALLTLDIQILSLSFGMTLKDASAYNVQFVGSRPVFIDTLSFEIYEPDAPWVAYRQFCEHFLGPLALMAYRDVRLRQLMGRFIDGIPLDLVAGLLPLRTRARFGLLAHIHMHARSQERHRDVASTQNPTRIPRLPKSRLIALIESLRTAVEGCRLQKRSSPWSHYYDETNYSEEAMAAKEVLVKRLIDETPRADGLIHDIGANTGRFSRLVADRNHYVVSHDIDELAVEYNHLQNKQSGNRFVLPLVLDLANPSPAMGWALEERSSSIDRISGGTVLALALVHHLAISNNVPLDQMATLFGRLAETLIIEFVPKEDSQVRRLLTTRQDIFPDYTRAEFEATFSRTFHIVKVLDVPATVRTLYAMQRR